MIEVGDKIITTKTIYLDGAMQHWEKTSYTTTVRKGTSFVVYEARDYFGDEEMIGFVCVNKKQELVVLYGSLSEINLSGSYQIDEN